jgi:hypothetical protein
MSVHNVRSVVALMGLPLALALSACGGTAVTQQPSRASTATMRPPATAKPTLPARPTSCPNGCVTLPACATVIKGNKNLDTREQIYHVPGQAYYDETVVDPSEGERWFCTEAEAVANGWRRSKL